MESPALTTEKLERGGGGGEGRELRDRDMQSSKIIIAHQLLVCRQCMLTESDSVLDVCVCVYIYLFYSHLNVCVCK